MWFFAGVLLDVGHAQSDGLRQIAEDASVEASSRKRDMQKLHQSFCNTLTERLRPIIEAAQQAPPPAIPAPSTDDIRAEVVKILDTLPRYAQNPKKDSRKWHKLEREFGAVTPILLRAPCGWKAGRSYHTEVTWTLGKGPRCDKCFRDADWLDD